MKESKNIEYKESYSKTFLKTVSAFANYGTGKIIFGVNDKGETVGVVDPTTVRLSIENAINDTLDPRPFYSVEEKQHDNKSIIEVTVYEGADKPYLCSGKAYQRFDTSTVAVDRSELRRLSILGSDIPFDEMPAPEQNLTFETLKKSLEEKAGIKGFSTDTLVILGLLSGDELNNAALLLSDQNTFPGLDIVRYAQDETSMHKRVTVEGVSVLDQLNAAMEEYRENYVVERIDGLHRELFQMIPEESFREAVANALAHRIWYVDARITVSLFPERIEIVFPGGLPVDIDEELYLSGGISLPRNAALAYVLLRLGIIERLGTGIRRTKRAYEGSLAGPSFDISDRAIKVILPKVALENDLDEDERKLLALFSPGLEVSGAELERGIGVSRSTVMRTVSRLLEKGALQRIGSGRSTRYRLS